MGNSRFISAHHMREAQAIFGSIVCYTIHNYPGAITCILYNALKGRKPGIATKTVFRIYFTYKVIAKLCLDSCNGHIARPAALTLDASELGSAGILHLVRYKGFGNIHAGADADWLAVIGVPDFFFGWCTGTASK